jgi:dipeptidyl-peptidase-4
MTGQRHGFGPMTDYFFWLRADYFSKHLLGKSSESVDLIELAREAPQNGKRRPGAGGTPDEER